MTLCHLSAAMAYFPPSHFPVSVVAVAAGVVVVGAVEAVEVAGVVATVGVVAGVEASVAAVVAAVGVAVMAAVGVVGRQWWRLGWSCREERFGRWPEAAAAASERDPYAPTAS
ncbi:unnamed protein product, partial [Closterium sp. NIES-53]